MKQNPTQKQIEADLRKDVAVLAGDIGPRNTQRYKALEEAKEYLFSRLKERSPVVAVQEYQAGGVTVSNLWVDLPSENPEKIVIGAHYDTWGASPGADDNSSGVAGILALARMLEGEKLRHTVRLALFVNEEPPFFMSKEMGSMVVAGAMRSSGEKVQGMISLEMLGCFLGDDVLQELPEGFQLSGAMTGNSIGFVGYQRSVDWIRKAQSSFARNSNVHSAVVTAKAGTMGVDFSDHWSFEMMGYKGLMITDGGPFRNPRYHAVTDTPDTLQYKLFSEVVLGLGKAVPFL